jgi:hypothetical protein
MHTPKHAPRSTNQQNPISSIHTNLRYILTPRHIRLHTHTCRHAPHFNTAISNGMQTRRHATFYHPVVSDCMHISVHTARSYHPAMSDFINTHGHAPCSSAQQYPTSCTCEFALCSSVQKFPDAYIRADTHHVLVLRNARNSIHACGHAPRSSIQERPTQHAYVQTRAMFWYSGTSHTACIRADTHHVLVLRNARNSIHACRHEPCSSIQELQTQYAYVRARAMF